MPKFRDNIKKMMPYKPPLEGRSEGNYLLLDFNERTIEPSPKVLVRPKTGPGGKQGIRVSIGTPENTERFIEAFNQLGLTSISKRVN